MTKPIEPKEAFPYKPPTEFIKTEYIEPVGAAKGDWIAFSAE